VRLGWQQQHCREGAATFAAAATVQKLVIDMLQQFCNKRKKRRRKTTSSISSSAGKSAATGGSLLTYKFKKTINRQRCSREKAVVWRWAVKAGAWCWD